MKRTLSLIYERDLIKLKEEIQAYDKESNLWVTSGDIENSAGNLCLHLCGNLQHFIGALIGKSGYVRDREAEFKSKNIPRAELIEGIDKTIDAVKKYLPAFDESKSQDIFPQKLGGQELTYEYALIHFVAHFNYHLGQVNYLRRILDKK